MYSCHLLRLLTGPVSETETVNVILLIKHVADTATLNTLLHRLLAMGEVVIFLAFVLLTACRSLSTEVTSNWLESANGLITPQSGISDSGTAIVSQPNATVLTDDNSTFIDRVKWMQLRKDANANQRSSHNNVTENDVKDQTGLKMTIRHVSTSFYLFWS